VFTAGIGENRPSFRELVCANLDQLGIVLDREKNGAAQPGESVISAPNSGVKIMVIPTNEELVVARETRQFLERSGLAHLEGPATVTQRNTSLSPLIPSLNSTSTTHK
jgi:acetate kinase